MIGPAICKTLESLKCSSFRKRFKLAEKEREYIRRKGMETIRRHAHDFVVSRIAQQFPENDGRQTPMKNHPVFIAQHATATCCRGCLEKWHHIPRGKVLNDTEISFIIDLIMAWIALQMKEC